MGRRQQSIRSQSQVRTYAAVSKLSKDISKLVSAQTSCKPDSIIQLNSNTMRELLKLNNLTDVVYLTMLLLQRYLA